MISHDPSLVLLSSTIAILGAFTACVLTSGLLSLPRSEARLRLTMASFALGGSVWATHFVGLLAISLPINWSWNPVLLALSALFAISATTAALFLAGSADGVKAPQFPAAIAIFGFGLAVANYLGLGAIAGQNLSLSWFLVMISLAICFEVAAAGLWFLVHRRGVVLTLLGAVLFGLGLTATHYVAVASAQGLDQALLAIPPGSGVSERYLAWAATIIMYLVCSICLCIFVIMQFRDDIR